MAILRRTERAILRSMSDIKLIEKRSRQEFTDWLGFEETLYRLSEAKVVGMYGRAMRRIKMM